MRRFGRGGLALSLVAASLAWPASAADTLKWSGWTEDLFTKAKAENKLVVLDLEAVWCHWCHVMEQQTYSNAKVQGLIDAKYIPVRVDQDGNPDLSSRYGDWGWPATIIFAPDGKELAKMRGFVEPEKMASILKAFADDPTPGPSAGQDDAVKPAENAILTKAQKDELTKTFDESYDTEHGGWGGMLRYIDGDSMDYTISLAERGDKTAEARAKTTFDAALALIDPVWGGVYQYSDKTDWSSPHFEKIMSYQSQYLREYAQAYTHWHDPKYVRAATAIEGYLTKFLLSPEGAFWTSQDADLSHEVDGHVYYAKDDAERRKLGMPRIDKHLYARENGWAISGLAAYYGASVDTKALDIAEGAAKWVEANRAIKGGGFKHGAEDRGGPFIGDTLAMGQAFLDLYAATGDRKWLEKAGAAGDFIGATFRDDDGGFLPAKTMESKALAKAPKQLGDQIQVARFMNLLGRYIGKAAYKNQAAHAMRYAVGAGLGMEGRPLPGLLLADLELGRDPTHVTVVGHKDDPAAQALGKIARATPAEYIRLDWWDPREGALANPDIGYPELDRAAAFACGNRTCSLPAFSAEELSSAIMKMAKRQVPTKQSEN